ncbi:hypothetical protein [Mucilaginibacter sp.]|uniref:hypothetical protein n=1 Tax=Mucilaginibacter sp. TaxID=1882438 RepID=UPI002615C4E7|nr:hypothetical protein [Mucilaginibacter sp.]MDB5032464.1 hypothetical protein [Mucilaginibacter sp.]
MRIIAELPHPEFKISIFNMNQKFIVKIEKGVLEQSYKIAEMDLTEGVNSVFELLDEEFLKAVAARFAEMAKDFKSAYFRYNY